MTPAEICQELGSNFAPYCKSISDIQSQSTAYKKVSHYQSVTSHDGQNQWSPRKPSQPYYCQTHWWHCWQSKRLSVKLATSYVLILHCFLTVQDSTAEGNKSVAISQFQQSGYMKPILNSLNAIISSFWRSW